MSDRLVDLQEDLRLCLLSWTPLATINVVGYRKARVEDESAIAQVCLTPRAGKSGCGIIVEMPTIASQDVNTPNPVDTLDLSCVVIEDPTLNMEGANGTLLSAEYVARQVRLLMHSLNLEDFGSLWAVSMTLAQEWEPLGIAYRITSRLRLHEDALASMALPTIAEDAGEITLTGSGDVYYTTDGTFPGPGNSAATLYSAPFSVDVGTVIRWAAWDDTSLPSTIGQTTVTA
jgi:hypothetical protein